MVIPSRESDFRGKKGVNSVYSVYTEYCLYPICTGIAPVKGDFVIVQSELVPF